MNRHIFFYYFSVRICSDLILLGCNSGEHFIQKTWLLFQVRMQMYLSPGTPPICPVHWFFPKELHVIWITSSSYLEAFILLILLVLSLISCFLFIFLGSIAVSSPPFKWCCFCNAHVRKNKWLIRMVWFFLAKEIGEIVGFFNIWIKGVS